MPLKKNICLNSVGKRTQMCEYMLTFCGETYSDVSLRKKKVAVALDQVNFYMVPRLGS